MWRRVYDNNYLTTYNPSTNSRQSLGTIVGCSLKFYNLSRYGLNIYRGSEQVDYVPAYQYVVLPNEDDYSLELDAVAMTDYVHPFSAVTVKTIEGVKNYETGALLQTTTQAPGEVVNVAGNMNISSMPTVNAVIQSGKVDIGSMPTVNANIAGQSVNIGSMPTVNANIAGQSVNIGSMPNVQFASGQTLNIGTMPAVSLAGSTKIDVGTITNLTGGNIAVTQQPNAASSYAVYGTLNNVDGTMRGAYWGFLPTTQITTVRSYTLYIVGLANTTYTFTCSMFVKTQGGASTALSPDFGGDATDSFSITTDANGTGWHMVPCNTGSRYANQFQVLAKIGGYVGAATTLQVNMYIDAQEEKAWDTGVKVWSYQNPTVGQYYDTGITLSRKIRRLQVDYVNAGSGFADARLLFTNYVTDANCNIAKAWWPANATNVLSKSYDFPNGLDASSAPSGYTLTNLWFYLVSGSSVTVVINAYYAD